MHYKTSGLQFPQGIALIEVLVVLIILTISLLGMAGLQIVSVKQYNNSGLQTQAMLLTQNLIERIRANPDAVIPPNAPPNQHYRKLRGTAFPTLANANCTNGKTCSEGDMAISDLISWSRMIQNSLPVDNAILQDETIVCLDSDSSDNNICDGLGSTFFVQLAWNEKSSTDDKTIQYYQMVFEP